MAVWTSTTTANSVAAESTLSCDVVPDPHRKHPQAYTVRDGPPVSEALALKTFCSLCAKG